MFPALKTVAKRFVLEAVVEKKLVEVEFVVVEVRAVKFWRVVEASAKILVNVPRPEAKISPETEKVFHGEVVPTPTFPLNLFT